MTGSYRFFRRLYQSLGWLSIFIFISGHALKAQSQEFNLVPNDLNTNDRFGEVVSMSGDYAVVGSSFDDDQGRNSGSVYVYRRTGSEWIQQAKLQARQVTEKHQFGRAVDIDGDDIIVGAVDAAYLFVRVGTTWQQRARIIQKNAIVQRNFGSAVAISGDHFIIGADDGNGKEKGRAYIYQKLNTESTQWRLEAKFIGLRLGMSVDIEGDYAIAGDWGGRL